MRKCFPLIILFLAWVWLDAAAQFATITGEVVHAETDDRLPGTNLQLKSASGLQGTATDGAGRFAFIGVKPGTYALIASHVGFSPWSDTIDVAFGENIHMVIPLEPVSEELDELVVESDDQGPIAAPGAGHVRILPAALQTVPMPDVSADLAAFLLTRPGVVATGDRGGQLFIRGGTPTQNLVLLDGMHIYRPFHIVGFYSIFPADIVAYADIYAGGFGARYGGRLSSVIDVTTRNGSKQEFSGSASIAPFLAAVRAEIPFVPNKISLVASVRESVIERLAPALIDVRLPYRFGDRFLKVHAHLNRTSSASATLLHSFDEGDIAAVEGEERLSTWTNTAIGGRYYYLPEDFPATAEFAVYGTRYESTYFPAEGERRLSNVETLDLKIRFAYLFGDLQFHSGISGSTHWLDYDLGRPSFFESQNFTEGGFFFSTEWEGERVRLSPGIRVEGYSNGTGMTLEPRFRAEWKPGGRGARQSFSAAWGIYHQQFLGLNNQRDVTDAFTAWAASPRAAPLPRSVHLIAGTSRQLLPFLTLGVEAYHRSLANILFPFLGDGLGSTARLERVDGDARGLDVTLEFRRPWAYLYAGYGLSLVEYKSLRRLSTGQQTDESFNPPHDRRHSLNVQAQLSGGAYRLSMRWQYGSGVPFTPVREFYYAATPRHPRDRSFLTDEGGVQTVFGAAYSRRLPAYHRLDVSAERDFQFDGWRIVVHGGVVNVYDRANIFSYDVLNDRRVDQLPLIPSVGFRVEIDE